jgi:transmembrane sensor
MSEPLKSGLPLPLRDALEPALDRGTEERLWRRIQERRGVGAHSEPPKAGMYLPANLGTLLEGDGLVSERSQVWREIRARRHESKNRSAGFKVSALSFGLAAAMTALMLWAVGLSPSWGTGAPRVAGALLTTEGQPLRGVEAGPSRKLVELADASEIRLDPGARLEPLLSTDSRFEVLLRKGSAEFSVTPGGPRRWVVETGIATVEVVGTVFRVTREHDRVDVSVSRGIVLVRSDGLADHVQRLTAGESVSVKAPAPTRVDIGEIVIAQEPGAEPIVETPPDQQITLAEATLAAASSAHSAPAPQGPARERPAAPAWSKHLAEGEYAAAYSVLGEKGLRREIERATSVERLLSLADVARLSGHPVEAIAPLKRVLSEHRSTAHAALAAFTLGRVHLDQLRDPASAAQAFELAISLRPPHALLADAHTRLVEAYARAGNDKGAAQAASRYRTLFPTAKELPDPARWAQP